MATRQSQHHAAERSKRGQRKRGQTDQSGEEERRRQQPAEQPASDERHRSPPAHDRRQMDAQPDRDQRSREKQEAPTERQRKAACPGLPVPCGPTPWTSRRDRSAKRRRKAERTPSQPFAPPAQREAETPPARTDSAAGRQRHRQRRGVPLPDRASPALRVDSRTGPADTPANPTRKRAGNPLQGTPSAYARTDSTKTHRHGLVRKKGEGGVRDRGQARSAAPAMQVKKAEPESRPDGSREGRRQSRGQATRNHPKEG